MDFEKLARDIKELCKVGELNYEGPCSGEVQEQANNAAGDAEKAVSVVPTVRSLDILVKVVVKAEMNKSGVEQEIFKQFTEMPASERLPRPHLRVNLAGQSRKRLWVRHTTKMVDQQQIISRVYRGKVEDQVAGMKQTVNMILYKWNLYSSLSTKIHFFELEASNWSIAVYICQDPPKKI